MHRIAEQPAVLLTEANAIVGMDLTDALERAGYRVLGPLASAAEALSLLKRETPTLAIVDVMLRDGRCPGLVRELRQRGVPFLVHLEGVPWLVRPALPGDVTAVCNELSLTSSEPLPAQPTPHPQLVPSSRPVEPMNTSSNPLVRKLAGYAALSDVDRAMLERISAQTRIVAPRTDLVREGDKPDGVFLVMEGFAARLKHRANGDRQIMAYLLPGDLCDVDVALLDRMDHTITTLSVCKVVRIAPETVAELMQQHPQVARALRMTTLVDEATLREWLVNVGCRSALERIAHLFCELQVRLQAVGLASDGSYHLPINQVDIADTTGLTNVHVNRSLQALLRKGLIELKGRRLTILDLPRLKALAEFRADYLHTGDRAVA